MNDKLVERVARALEKKLLLIQRPDTAKANALELTAAALQAAGVDELVEALLPFAKAADIRLCASEDYWTDDKAIQGTDIAFHVTFGDLRSARTALQKLEE